MLLRVASATSQAAVLYKTEIQDQLFRNIGSIPVSAGKRKRIHHSKAGQVPYWQTGNLRNSIRVSTNFRRSMNFGTRSFSFKARISTPVIYAKTLERGGALSVPQRSRHRRHTQIKLVNPIRDAIVIAPRPVWIPTFNKLSGQMLGLIARAMRR